ncbi:asparagine synthase [Lentzea alba]|uniref:asparagine synthase-related protein n=1 Tax=Lentzea alba TaxID=2714351 RepID=UPI0039BF7331
MIGAEGFVVLPDVDSAAFSVFSAPEVLRYPSGRPWVMGRDLTSVSCGSIRVVLVGACPVSTTRLTSLVSRIRCVDDVSAFARSLPGSVHVVASVGGVVRVQGSITGLRSVFHAVVAGVPVASDRADVLARLLGSSLDDDVLAVRLISVNLPPPLCDRSVWRGVSAVPADSYLTLDPLRVVRWWTAPEPSLGLAEGAPAVRDALVAASSTPGRPSADLSGGLDSTSLCFLTRPDLITARLFNGDPANDDPVFADLACAALPLASHVVVGRDDLPGMFGDLGSVVDPEGPALNVRTAARNLAYARLLASRGARWHLAGHGGDQLFSAPLSYLHTLARGTPFVALRHLRGYRARYRWPLGSSLVALASRRDLVSSWARLADDLTAPRPARSPLVSWLPPLRMPPWASADAVSTARRVLRSVEVAPFAADRGQHGTLANLRTYSHSYRMMARTYRAGGLSLHLPYFDDRVVEAVLAVRLSERTTPWRYKPLLVEAMQGRVPSGVLARRTKGEFSVDAHSGLRANLPSLLSLFADSGLASRGLIDVDVLRSRLVGAHRDNQNLLALDATLACEVWLRVVSGRSESKLVTL